MIATISIVLLYTLCVTVLYSEKTATAHKNTLLSLVPNIAVSCWHHTLFSVLWCIGSELTQSSPFQKPISNVHV